MRFLLFLHEFDAQNVLLTSALTRPLFNSVLMGLARPDSYSSYWCFVLTLRFSMLYNQKKILFFYMNMRFISSRDEKVSIFTLHENGMK